MDDLTKINLISQDIDYERILQEIKTNEIALKLIKELNLTDNEIKENYVLINNYIKENKSCFNCKGKDNCSKATKMYKYTLIRSEDMLEESIIICPYFKDYYKRKENIVYTTFDEDIILDESQKNFLADNINLFGNDLIKKLTSIIKKENIYNGFYLENKDSKIRLNLIKSLSYKLLAKFDVAIVKMQELLVDIKEEFNTNPDQKVLDKIAKASILIIDGLGQEAITPWSRDEILFSILDNRLQNNKITIICSEYSKKELKELYAMSRAGNDALKVNKLIEKIEEIDRS